MPIYHSEEALKPFMKVQSVGKGGLLIKYCKMMPSVTRLILRAYLHSGLPIPERIQWVIRELRSTLVPTGAKKKVRIGRKLQIETDISASIGNSLYFEGSSEPALARFMAQILCPGDIFIDGGAHIGEFTLRAAKLVGPNGKVLSVEASPDTYRLLQHNVSLNGLSNVIALQGAVGGSDGEGIFYLGAGEECGSSSLTPPHNYRGVSLSTRLWRLDSLLSKYELSAVAMIKLDIEGAELEALRDGAKTLLSGALPGPVIVFEYNSSVAYRARWSLADIVTVLKGYDYELRELMSVGLGPIVDPVANTSDLKRDYVAVKRGRVLAGG